MTPAERAREIVDTFNREAPHGFEVWGNMRQRLEADIATALAAQAAQTRHLEEIIQDTDEALDRIAAPPENDGIPGKVSIWRRVELVGKLLWRYRQQLETQAAQTRALREALVRIMRGETETRGLRPELYGHAMDIAAKTLGCDCGRFGAHRETCAALTGAPREPHA